MSRREEAERRCCATLQDESGWPAGVPETDVKGG